MTNLSWWPVIIHWYPTRYYFHNENSKTIYITRFIQHSSPCVLWSNVPVIIKKKLVPIHHTQACAKSVKVQSTESDPKVPITRVVT